MMNNFISGRVKVYDVYEHSNNTQTKRFRNVFADCLIGVKQAPCHIKALGAIGVVCGIASTLTYSFLCEGNFTSGNGTAVNTTVAPTPTPTVEPTNTLRYFGYISSGILAGLSMVSLAGYTYLSCARAGKLEDGELEVAVNDELSKMVVKYGDIEEVIELDTSNFISKMRKQMIEMCKYAMENDGDVADPYELIEMVCDYIDKLRENDSCKTFVLRSITEWFEKTHFTKFRDYQVKSGRPFSVSLDEMLAARNEALANVQAGSLAIDINESPNDSKDELVVAEFVFSDDSLAYDDEFSEVPL